VSPLELVFAVFSGMATAYFFLAEPKLDPLWIKHNPHEIVEREYERREKLFRRTGFYLLFCTFFSLYLSLTG
jgi:hypothetical protein